MPAGRWYPAFRCSQCHTRLSYSQVMDSRGVCPYCSHHSHSTVLDYDPGAARVIWDPKRRWWRLWIRRPLREEVRWMAAND